MIIINKTLYIKDTTMRKQSGFTLIELAIVLVIIGLLLGSVLKGQSWVDSAKVKNMAADFRNVPAYIYVYQDKFRALPGDDAHAVDHLGSASGAQNTTNAGKGNGQLDGRWNDTPAVTSETTLFWQHVRLAGLSAGATEISDEDYIPKNADGGNIGFEAGRVTEPAIKGLGGTYVLCSSGILGKYVKQLDITLDNGNTASGSMMATPFSGYAVNKDATATTAIVDSTPYIVCSAS
jgi:prepilin-type N-terminal cleavage/methylation domain-containing protein